MGRAALAAIAVTFAMLALPGAAAAQTDIKDQLEAIPGMTVIEPALRASTALAMSA